MSRILLWPPPTPRNSDLALGEAMSDVCGRLRGKAAVLAGWEAEGEQELPNGQVPRSHRAAHHQL